MSFVGFHPLIDRYFALVPAMIFIISCHNGPHYNGTALYVILLPIVYQVKCCELRRSQTRGHILECVEQLTSTVVIGVVHQLLTFINSSR